MTYLGQEKPSIDDLLHFGVKGMHWGQRKKAARVLRDHGLV